MLLPSGSAIVTGGHGAGSRLVGSREWVFPKVIHWGPRGGYGVCSSLLGGCSMETSVRLILWEVRSLLPAPFSSGGARGEGVGGASPAKSPGRPPGDSSVAEKRKKKNPILLEENRRARARHTIMSTTREILGPLAIGVLDPGSFRKGGPLHHLLREIRSSPKKKTRRWEKSADLRVENVPIPPRRFQQ